MKRDRPRKKRGVCAHCGKAGVTQIHHIFGGAYRGRSEANDFVVELCPACHRLMHDTSIGLELQRAFQRKWERMHKDLDDPGAEWIRLMGKSWL